MTNWVKFLKDIIGGFSGDGGAAQDDSIKASLDLAHTDLDAIITDIGTVDALVSPAEIIANIFDWDMGYWTEVDGPGRVTIDYVNERIAIDDLDSDEDVYVYKATDANVTDFILDFEFQILSTCVVGSYAGIGLADSVGTMRDINNGLYARIAFSALSVAQISILHSSGAGGSLASAIIDLVADTVYYGRLIRRDQYCWLGIYTDRIKETHVSGSPVEYRDVSPASFTHLYPVSGWDDGTPNRSMDAYVEAIKLISAPDIDKYLGRHVA